MLEILDQLDRMPPVGYERGVKAVVVGDSMGGGPTGLRVAIRDEERVKEEKREKRILGVVVCGSAAEVESEGQLTLVRASGWAGRALIIFRAAS